MIKENQKYLNRFHVVLDALVIYCSFCLSYYIRYICPLFKDIFPRFGYWRQLWQYQGILLVLIPVYLILYAKFNLYWNGFLLYIYNLYEDSPCFTKSSVNVLCSFHASYHC